MENFKKYFIVVLTITFMGELYFYPFFGSFRFSAGVLALSLTILFDNSLKEYKLSIYTGISVLLLRFFIDSNHIIDPIVAIKENLPGSIYYIMFGILARVFSVRKNRNDNLYIPFSLFIIDVVCNLIEALIRQNLNTKLLHYILIVGLFRGLLAFIIYRIYKNQELLIRKKEHQKRYIQLNTFVSGVQAEVFYLKKSLYDIEKVMSKSYALYEHNKDNEKIKDEALNIAREVHEIKKDYHRVINGFTNFISNFEENDSMDLNDIFFIIESNANRFITESKKNISLNIIVHYNIKVDKFYPIFTILNNLIINSIEAIDNNGIINIEAKVESGILILHVTDNGDGIEEDLIPYLFNPGFTTKFDETTGSPSTGIGLSHIKNILDELNGTIKIKSTIKIGTEFIINIPIDTIRGWFNDKLFNNWWWY